MPLGVEKKRRKGEKEKRGEVFEIVLMFHRLNGQRAVPLVTIFRKHRLAARGTCGGISSAVAPSWLRALAFQILMLNSLNQLEAR